MWWVAAVAWATPDVVMVGNSYMMRNDLAGVLAARLDEVAAAGAEPRTLDLALGGYTWAQHRMRLDQPGAFQTAFAEPRDVVILQEQSQTPGFPQSDPSYQDSSDSGLALFRAAQATGAATVLMNTWGHRDGDENNPGLSPDYLSMQDHLDEGYRAYQDAWEAATGERPARAPVGDAWRAVHDAGAEGFNALFDNDGSHPTPVGTFVASHVLTAALTGRRAISGGEVLPEEVRARLQEIAAGVVFDDPFGPDAYPWAYDWARWTAARGTDPVSGAWDTPWVRVAGEVGIADLVVGAAHAEGAGEGRLFIADGASVLGTGAWTVGDGGHGVLVVEGGSAQVASLTLGATGELTLTGGALQVGALTGGVVQVSGGVLTLTGVADAGLSLSAGEVVLDGATALGGDLVQTGGKLTLGAPVAVDGDVSLVGALVVPDGDVILTSPTITADVVATDAGGAEVAVEVVRGEAGDQLVRVGAGGRAGPGQGCGCDAAGGSGAWWWLAGLGLRRRR